jgi:hypothetical protein
VLSPERRTTGHLDWFAAPLVLPGGVVAETCSRTDSAGSGRLSTRLIPRRNGHARGYCLALAVARMARFGVRSGSRPFARSDGKPERERFERTGANGRERTRALAMQKVVGSSPIIRSQKAPLGGFFVASVGTAVVSDTPFVPICAHSSARS